MNAVVQPASFAASPAAKPQSIKARSVTQEQIARITSIVGSDMELHGQYVGRSAQAGLCIEGRYQGSIKFAEGGVVRIAEGANVMDSDVEADVVLIEGNFTGTVRARKLIEILPCATIEGSIHYVDLDMHRGARVKAELITMEVQELAGSEGVNAAAANYANGARNLVPKIAPQVASPSPSQIPNSIQSVGASLIVAKADA